MHCARNSRIEILIMLSCCELNTLMNFVYNYSYSHLLSCEYGSVLLDGILGKGFSFC